jgi:hypothetical protein
MTHPVAVADLPPECIAVSDRFDPRAERGPGRCLYQPLVGIAERDPRFDRFINSQERGTQSYSETFLKGLLHETEKI